MSIPVLTQVSLTIKMADNFKKRGSAKVKTASKRIWHQILWWLNIQKKWTHEKQQENAVAPGMSKAENNRNRNSVQWYENISFFTDSKTRCSVSFMDTAKLNEQKSKSSTSCMMWRNKFPLQQTSYFFNKCQSNANEIPVHFDIPANYTTDVQLQNCLS
jgi:hypothetical protein